MTRRRPKMRIYTVVDVMTGVAVGVESFLNSKDAKMCLRRLRKGRNLDEDDVQLFEGVIDMSGGGAALAESSQGEARS